MIGHLFAAAALLLLLAWAASALASANALSRGGLALVASVRALTAAGKLSSARSKSFTPDSPARLFANLLEDEL